MYGRDGDILAAKSLTFTQFVDHVAKKADTSRKEAREWVELVFDQVKGNLTKGVKVPGFGKFQVRSLKARWGRNPQTGEKIKISARKKIAFTPAKELKEKFHKK